MDHSKEEETLSRLNEELSELEYRERKMLEENPGLIIEAHPYSREFQLKLLITILSNRAYCIKHKIAYNDLKEFTPEELSKKFWKDFMRLKYENLIYSITPNLITKEQL